MVRISSNVRVESAASAPRAVPVRAVSAADLPIRIIATEATPLYLQIVLQLKQLIMTGALSDGVQLPAVRSLASHLEVNPGTVMQAYRELASEGLTASIRGRGSVVRTLSRRSDDALEREKLLDAAVARLAARARALGFEPAETLQRMSAALLSSRDPVPVVFLGLTAAQAQRYTDELNAHFAGANVDFRPYSMAEVLGRDPGLLEQLHIAYTVIAFAPRVPEVERALDEWGVSVEIIGVRAELSGRSRRALANMSPERDYTVITERRAVTTILALIDVEPDEVLGIDEHDPPSRQQLDAIAAGGSTIIYSFGVQDVVRSLSVKRERLLPLEFELTESTWEELTAKFGRGAGEGEMP